MIEALFLSKGECCILYNAPPLGGDYALNVRCLVQKKMILIEKSKGKNEE